ncbi:hypothetical protein MAPG_04012 [Magnaporthiopsis poae ATCC 64411]|uniref:Uncharacterized protein n=1 Tax=Magnaporthiopsis poae (strain ATCC 64411 / 73-15) TaxID=644358 RepID=A0A0C4DVK6_MAGP6|nr:hypothetical protein MAPG_04012 [Magnaporthiopsis poae ATCC 64411]
MDEQGSLGRTWRARRMDTYWMDGKASSLVYIREAIPSLSIDIFSLYLHPHQHLQPSLTLTHNKQQQAPSLIFLYIYHRFLSTNQRNTHSHYFGPKPTTTIKMQFTTVLTALLATAVSAAPAPAEVSKRACQFVAPSPAGLSVSKGNPHSITVDARKPLVYTLQHDSDGRRLLITRYACPWCYFPAGFPIQSSGNAAVNVIDLNGNSPGSIVGTITFQSSPTEPTRRFINSFGCRPYMAYRLEIAGEGPASVSYAAQAGAGLRISHSC